jgi:hypothetical protein
MDVSFWETPSNTTTRLCKLYRGIREAMEEGNEYVWMINPMIEPTCCNNKRRAHPLIPQTIHLFLPRGTSMIVKGQRLKRGGGKQFGNPERISLLLHKDDTELLAQLKHRGI